MIISGASDIGRVRSSNQDSFITGKISDSVGFVVVCDGMGGANGGEIASATAIERFLSVCERDITPEAYIEELSGSEKKFFKKLYAGRFAKKLYRLYEYKKA